MRGKFLLVAGMVAWSAARGEIRRMSHPDVTQTGEWTAAVSADHGAYGGVVWCSDREGAALEMPHVMVFIDDPEDGVMGLADRLMVMYEGEQTGMIERKDFYNENGKLYVVQGDCAGNMYILEGATGKRLFWQKIGDNFESSPAVVDNALVVGSRGKIIFKMLVE